MVVQNWGAARGFTGGTFEVKDVEHTSITVAGGNMQMLRRISKGDFEQVYARAGCLLGDRYPRSKMTNISQNTTYIISVLHHFGL
jgi:hypothetical protein